MTPTQLAYAAWQNTPQPMIYETRDDKGNDLTVEVVLVSPESRAHYDAEWAGVCQICGGEFIGGVPAEKFLGTNYTDWSIHKAPESTHICGACVWAMSLNAERSRQTLSRYSFVASATGLTLCNRAQMRDALTNPPEPPFVAVVAASQKKHLVTKALASHSRERYWCMLEEERVDIRLDMFRRYIAIIEALRGLGATKDEIGACNFRYERLREWGQENFERIVDLLCPYIKDRAFKLALHVAQKNDSEEAYKCYLGFQPRT